MLVARALKNSQLTCGERHAYFGDSAYFGDRTGAQRLAQLPPISKKIMALYYYENMQLTELAACFGFTEDKIRQILLHTLDLLRTFVFHHDN